MFDELNAIADAIRDDFVRRNAARDAAIARSRELIRHCSEAIRAVHRREWDNAEGKLGQAQAGADELRGLVAGFPDLYYSGYVQDALKEVVEAFATYAIVRGQPLPTLAALRVEASIYINGLAEAATELRRFILDILRRDDGSEAASLAEAERLLGWMDAVYDHLVAFDFPDAITGDLRRRTDVVRGVLERTRGDLTTTIQQNRLQAALKRFEGRVTN
jgi:translin